MKQSGSEPFSLAALERISKIIGERYTGTEITELFRKAGFPDFHHDGSTKWRWVYWALEQLQSKYSGPKPVAIVIQQVCNPEEYVGNAEGYEQTITQINEVLKFYGLAVNKQTGKIIVTGKKDTSLSTRESEKARQFNSRSFHPEVIKHGRQLFIEDHHFHAVFECCKAFDKYVANKSQIDKRGQALMGAALSLKGPLKLNSQRTESERNEQEGVMYLCMGLMNAIRNPEGHEPELDWPISPEDALDIMSMISFLYRQVDKAVYYTSP